MQSFAASLRVAALSIAVCVVGYTTTILGLAQVFARDSANGSLIANAEGTVVGSRSIAQEFTLPRYFWPRPSAVGYNASGAGGSNKASTSPDLTARAEALIARYGATPEQPLPPELATASGSGLDPHLSEHAALYQAERVARARDLPLALVEELIRERAFRAGGPLTTERIVNVLELNISLDAAAPR